MFGAMDGSLESWRRFFKGAGTDICTVIEHAILVAQCDRPMEFRKRRDEIAQRLYTPMCVKCLKRDSVTPVEHATTGATTVAGRDAEPVQPSRDVRRKDSNQNASLLKKDNTKNSLLPRLNKQTASEEELKARIEVSKRKIQEGYRQAADAKRRRRIQVLPIKDIPKDLPRTKPNKPNNTRQGCHQHKTR